MAQLADAVVLVAQGAPALVFLDEAVLQVVLVGERPVAVVDVYEATEGVVAVVNLLAIGEGFYQQTASGVALILGNEFAAVIAEFGFIRRPCGDRRSRFPAGSGRSRSNRAGNARRARFRCR